MNPLLTKSLDQVTIHRKGADYTFPRNDGAVEIPYDEIGDMPETVALILILLAESKRLYLSKETYFAIRDGVRFHLDRANGGLTEAAMELFEDDAGVLEAAKLHREAFTHKPIKK